MGNSIYRSEMTQGGKVDSTRGPPPPVAPSGAPKAGFATTYRSMQVENSQARGRSRWSASGRCRTLLRAPLRACSSREAPPPAPLLQVGLPLQAERRAATAAGLQRGDEGIAVAPRVGSAAPAAFSKPPPEPPSTYLRDFNLQANPPHATLKAGTSQSSKHLPGFGGFIPSSSDNPVAVQQGLEPAPGKGEVKQAVLLSTLDQFSRGRMPGYAGFRTQAPSNSGLAQRSGPMLQTSTGAIAASCAACFAPPPRCAPARAGRAFCRVRPSAAERLLPALNPEP